MIEEEFSNEDSPMALYKRLLSKKELTRRKGSTRLGLKKRDLPLCTYVHFSGPNTPGLHQYGGGQRHFDMAVTTKDALHKSLQIGD